jgi:hypothetical protein
MMRVVEGAAVTLFTAGSQPELGHAPIEDPANLRLRARSRIYNSSPIAPA